MIKHLLSDGNTNAKTAKNKRKSFILYLSPASQNSKGVNLCPKASHGCLASCLFTAGRGAFNNVQQSRINKTEYYLNNRIEFMQHLSNEIKSKASKAQEEIAIRLNGTSDIPLVKGLNTNLFPSNVVFYDYTKIRQKAGRHTLESGHTYVVAFSRSESNEAECLEVLKNGGIVAAVFDELPETWNGYPVVDGDSRDDLILDVEGAVVLGLKAKGKARKDNSGFVIKTK